MNWKSSALPPWKVSPSILPSKSTVTRSPSCAAASCGRWAKVRRCLRRMSRVLSMAASLTSVLSFSTSARGQVADLDFGVHLEHRVESQLALGRCFLLGDLGLAGDAQLGLVGGLRESLADLVVHHLVVHRVAVALGHDGHRHLAGTEAVHLDGARQLLQAGIDFGLDDVDGQRQRHLAFELLEGFNGHGHVGLSCMKSRVLVRGGGLEPPHHCWRQDLNLVRLPISPPALSCNRQSGRPGSPTARPNPVNPRF